MPVILQPNRVCEGTDVLRCDCDRHPVLAQIDIDGRVHLRRDGARWEFYGRFFASCPACQMEWTIDPNARPVLVSQGLLRHSARKKDTER